VVDPALRVAQVHGDARPYLSIPPSPVRLGRLRPPLTSALRPVVLKAVKKAKAERENQPIREELILPELDGTWRPIPVEAIPLRVREIQAPLVLVVFGEPAGRGERESFDRQTAAHIEEIRILAGQLISAQEEERRRISRELHDHLCNKLAALALDLEHLADSPPNPFKTRARLRELRARAISISEETRNIAYELHPSTLDHLGLEESLRELCDDFARREGIEQRISVGPLPRNISPCVALGLYRIAQEALGNVSKHAGAQHVAVTLRVKEQWLVFSLADDGVGFEPAPVRQTSKRGLANMAERARILGGNLEVESSLGAGTTILVRVPLAAARRA